MAKNLEIIKNGNIFIMPTKASKIDDFKDLRDTELKYAEKLCRANHRRFNKEKDWLVECGIYSEELDSTNIPNQGFTTEINSKIYRVFPGEISRYIPSRILATMKEGNQASIRFKDLQACELYSDEYGKHYEPPILLDLILQFIPSQTKYNFGEYNFKEFEKLLELVCR